MSFSLDGHVADVILVVAQSEEGISLFRVEKGAAGLSSSLVPGLDTTRKLAHVEFSSTPATRSSIVSPRVRWSISSMPQMR